MSLRGIVLDVDDTLFLERDYVASGFRAVGRWATEQLRVDGVAEAALALFESGRRGTTLTDALESCGVRITGEITREVVDVYRTHRPEISLLADASDFLTQAQRFARFAVVTDGPSASQWAKVRALGVHTLADPIVVSADYGTAKPDPALFVMATRRWGLEPPVLAYIGDNPAKDFVAPLQLGWKAYRVRRKGSLHVSSQTPPGVTELETLTELAPLLAANTQPIRRGREFGADPCIET